MGHQILQHRLDLLINEIGNKMIRKQIVEIKVAQSYHLLSDREFIHMEVINITMKLLSEKKVKTAIIINNRYVDVLVNTVK